MTEASVTPDATPQARRRRGLVMGALAGRRVGTPVVFIESLLATGTDADLMIFHHDVAPETLAYLASRNAILVPFGRYHRWWNGPVHTWRFVLFARYAAEHRGRYDHVMTADLRDVLFQSDPFAAIDTPAVHFFLEPPPGGTIAANRFYARWMRRFIPRKFHRAYERCPPACCGVILGGAAEMATYLSALAKRLRTVSLLQRHTIGADSAMHNLIAHITHDAPGIFVENDGMVATMGLAPKDNYTVDAAGLIRLPDGHAPAIVHQYDRHAALFSRSKYARLAAGAPATDGA
jgi:hypothetical protein